MGTVVEINHDEPPNPPDGDAILLKGPPTTELGDELNEDHPIEQVRLTVPVTDDPTLPCLTFRTWALGLVSSVLLAFLNQFFELRQNQFPWSSVWAQITVLPLGKLMAAMLPEKTVRVPLTNWSFTLNPGPFNLKEHVLITIFVNSGAGGVYAVNSIGIMKVFYHRGLHPMAAFLLAQTTQMLGFGWAGLFRKYLVDSPYMWWPENLVQVSLFRSILQLWRQTKKMADEKFGDVHSRLMKQNYDAVPQWRFYVVLIIVFGLSLFACEGFSGQLQLPYWGLMLACFISMFFTLPIGVITATTNQTPGLNVITEFVIGYMYPGKPIANVTFKTYGYISMTQALTFLADFKLGHYMKIPPKSMFIAQHSMVGTRVASLVYFSTAWWLLTGIKNICDVDTLPLGSPWTCPGVDAFYTYSVLWGVAGPRRMFGNLGIYPKMNYFFLVGLLAPVPVWLLSRAFPGKKWIKLINMPVILGATGYMPPASAVNYCWNCVQCDYIQEIQGLVGATQLRTIGWSRCRVYIYGSARLLHSPVQEYQWDGLVGRESGRPLPTGALSNCSRDSCCRMSYSLRWMDVFVSHNESFMYISFDCLGWYYGSSCVNGVFGFVLVN